MIMIKKATTVLTLLFISFIQCQFVDRDYPVIPEKCYVAPNVLYRQCCIFPPFFSREMAKMCGAMFVVMQINDNANASLIRRSANEPCDHWKCMLQKHGLLDADIRVDNDKYFNHLDKWLDVNPEFSKVMVNAKKHCMDRYRLFLPLKPCEFNILQSCIRNYINVNCPKMIRSEECNEVKEFYAECSEYYL